jgi:hypothetical protein
MGGDYVPAISAFDPAEKTYYATLRKSVIQKFSGISYAFKVLAHWLGRLPSHTCNLKIILGQFADDAQLLTSYDPGSEEAIAAAEQRMNQALAQVFRFCRMNTLLLNPSKTVAMCIGHPAVTAKARKPKLVIDGIVIPFVDHARNHGVEFDSAMTFKHHISKTVRNTGF